MSEEVNRQIHQASGEARTAGLPTLATSVAWPHGGAQGALRKPVAAQTRRCTVLRGEPPWIYQEIASPPLQDLTES